MGLSSSYLRNGIEASGAADAGWSWESEGGQGLALVAEESRWVFFSIVVKYIKQNLLF